MQLTVMPRRLRDERLGLSSLFVAGDPDLLDAPSVGIVGSRDASVDARHFARALARVVARTGSVIVSGGARGIDAAVHEAALEMGHRRNLCVLGSSLSPISPRPTASLCKRIIANGGTVVSEHPDGEQVFAGFFLERNRIVAALSDVLIVAAAREQSGSLHTAAWAKRLARPLWVVPGPPWDNRMGGSNQLIAKAGALPVTSIFDAEKLLRQILGLPPPSEASLDQVETLLSDRPLSGDELCVALKIDPQALPSLIHANLRDGRIVLGADGRYRLGGKVL